MAIAKPRSFPLYDRARQAGVLDDGSALIVAPTATGKSYIGRMILRQAAGNHEPGTHAYLVPYRALATEMYDSFQHELAADRLEARVRVATGDYTDPIQPQETDILIATYERFAGLMRMPELALGRVVVDEVHLVADHSRGPVLEGLLARMKSHKWPRSLCALSAVVANPEALGQWLGMPVLLGTAEDRAVAVELCCEETNDLDGALGQEVQSVLQHGDQAVIFCHSKASSQRLARDLQQVVAGYLTDNDRGELRDLVARVSEDDEDAKDLHALLSGGVAFHHAGLSRESRAAVESAFRERHLKVIACTPTLAAGVNLPARLVVVRDVFRTEFTRGFPQAVMLSTGELLNMLGRAGRPGQVESGRGVALVKNGDLEKDELRELQVAIREGRGNPVTSRLPDSFDALMRFLLSVAADRGEATLADLAAAVKGTLWFREDPDEIVFDRPFEADIMEDIESYARVTPDMRVERAWPVADGVAGSVASGDRLYNFSLRFGGEDCTCPAKAKWQRRNICKHLACAIHNLLFGTGVDAEARSRAIYASAHRFRRTLNLGTKIQQALRLLEAWKLLEPVPGAYQATPVGALAANSSLDLLLIRVADERIRGCRCVPTPKEVAGWIVEDYFGDTAKRERWERAVEPWLDEVEERRIKLPEKYRGDFERGLEQLGQVASLYGEIAESLGKPEVAEVCRLTRGCLQYGVAPELIPLAALRIPQLGRARCRFLYDDRGIRGLEELAHADPQVLAGPRAPASIVQQWVETARRMWQARGHVLRLPEEDRARGIDDFLSQFQVDQLSLFGENGVMGEAA